MYENECVLISWLNVWSTSLEGLVLECFGVAQFSCELQGLGYTLAHRGFCCLPGCPSMAQARLFVLLGANCVLCRQSCAFRRALGPYRSPGRAQGLSLNLVEGSSRNLFGGDGINNGQQQGGSFYQGSMRRPNLVCRLCCFLGPS